MSSVLTGMNSIKRGRRRTYWRAALTFRHRHPRLIDWALAAGVLALSVAPLIGHGAGERHDPLAAGAAFSVGLALPLAWRRRNPNLVFAIIAAVALLQWFAGLRLLGDVALLVALYAVTSTQQRRQSILAAGAVLIGVALASAKFAPAGDRVLPSLVFLSGLALAAFFIGTTVQNRRNYLASLVDRAERLERERDQQQQIAATAERTRIAREMHDIVAHSLTVIIALADGAALANPLNPAEATDAMHQVGKTGRQALVEMRQLLGVLREQSASAAEWTPQPGIAHLDDLVTEVRAAGLPATVTVTGRPKELSTIADTALYRVVQEGLTNALKHARGVRKVQVIVAWGDTDLTIDVIDDGAPSETGHGETPSTIGHGLLGMRERMAIFGGDVTAGRTPTGWRVRTRLPLEAVLTP